MAAEKLTVKIPKIKTTKNAKKNKLTSVVWDHKEPLWSIFLKATAQ
jgi:hypothetical protein